MQKERVTVTISKSLLEKVDSLVKGGDLRNRSHAIEFLVSKAIGPLVDTAFIFEGEKAVRMHPLTRRIPLTMIPVHGKPAAYHIVNWFKRNGFKRIVFFVGYKKEKIRDFFKDGSQLGIEVIYVDSQGKEAGTAGSLLVAREYLEGTFVVSRGDVLSKLDLKKMVRFHKDNNALVTVALKNPGDTSGHAVAELEGSRIKKFVDGKTREAPSNLVNAGVYVMDAGVFEMINTPSSITRDLLPQVAAEGRLYGYPFASPWVQIKGKESIKKAEEAW